jgi:hypothetical protein
MVRDRYSPQGRAVSEGRRPIVPRTVSTVEDLTKVVETDRRVQTQIASALSTELRNIGITSHDVDISIKTGADGKLTEFVVGSKSDDPLIQLQVADAAIGVLEAQGIDTSGISGFDPSVDPLAWNVIYKDGGWIING